MHWCATAEDARNAVLAICQAAGARTVTKGKSMIGEEIAINDHLERAGITPVETDLGEYIIQLRHELPSHIIAPAFHLNREDWEAQFRKSHTDLPADRVFHERRDILTEARTKLRERFLAADVGITGANFLIAETGVRVIVTNEGNGDLTQTLAARAYRAGQHREGGAHAGGLLLACCGCWRVRRRGRSSRFIPRSPPARGGRAISTDRTNTMSCCWTTGARRCSAASSRTCCGAFVARRA